MAIATLRMMAMRQRSEVMMSLPGLADACPNSRPRHVLVRDDRESHDGHEGAMEMSS